MTEPPTTELIVVRHGETVWNADGRMQGHLNSELTPIGIRQGEAIANRLAIETFDALYSSDLGRAYHTAEHIARKTRHDIITDARLRERKLGIFEGLTVAKIQQQYPDDYARFASGDPDYVIPDGESVRQRTDRTVCCVEEIVAQHPGQRVVIVAHGGILSGLFRNTLGIPLTAPRRYKLFNASINTFFVQDHMWTLGPWGDVHHLDAIGCMDDW